MTEKYKIGLFNVEKGEHTRELIREYLLTHLGASRKECAATLKLSVETVCKHVNALRKEWYNKG